MTKTLCIHLALQSMGVDAYRTYQISRTTFSAALSAAPVTILALDTALSLGQMPTKYPSRCRAKKKNRHTYKQIPPLSQVPTLHRLSQSAECRP